MTSPFSSYRELRLLLSIDTFFFVFLNRVHLVTQQHLEDNLCTFHSNEEGGRSQPRTKLKKRFLKTRNNELGMTWGSNAVHGVGWNTNFASVDR